MIKTEQEYQECLRRLKQDLAVIDAQRRELSAMGLDHEQIERALEPAHSFHEQLKEEVEWYERIKRRDFQPITNLSGLGQLLIAIRMASGITQSELAKRLGVDDSQISRDERNEYHGVSLERAERIISALNVRLTTSIQMPPVTEQDMVLF